jgi:hypothetical protein
MLMVLLPNPLWGRLMFAACALSILLVGYLLKRSANVEEVIRTIPTPLAERPS